jgi:hypothetical protein
VLLAALSCAASRAAAADASPSADDIQKLLGPDKRIRDSASFTTEKGEPATFVLYVTKVQAVDDGERVDLVGPMPPSCPEQVTGIALRGIYGLALIVGGALVNDLTIPPPPGSEDASMSLPLRNLPYYNHLHWGDGPPVESDPEARHTEPTKLLHLADFNGDGKPWELRLVQPGGACGHLDTLVAGYSAAKRAAVIFPVVAGPVSSEWSDNFFVDPAGGSGARIERSFPCTEHGSDSEVWQEYGYDAAREAWVLRRHRQRECDDAAARARKPLEQLATPLALAVGTAEGAPGAEVSIAVTLDTGDTPVARIAHAIVVDPRLSVAAIEGLDFSVASGEWTAADDGIGPINCASELVDTCQWAFSMRLDGGFRGHAVLYQLSIKIPPDAAPGAYRLENTKLSATGPKEENLPVDGKSGELVVRSAPAQ